MPRPGKALKQRRPINVRLRDKAPAPLIGYMRVSKADGSQVLDLQMDALLAAGVDQRHLYSDTASGKQEDRPGPRCLPSGPQRRRHARRLEA